MKKISKVSVKAPTTKIVLYPINLISTIIKRTNICYTNQKLLKVLRLLPYQNGFKSDKSNFSIS